MSPRTRTDARRVCALAATPIAIALVFTANHAHAQMDAGVPARSGSIHGCVETSKHPQLEESFPSKGKSGYAQTLVVKVHHGKGETVLPRGLDLS
ncbi:MAG: hypothetical protein ACRELY_15480, partial [Polyangiaceae bacterium]